MKGHIALVGLLASLLVADTLPASAQDARVEANSA
jgi:hypothetical protein